MQDNVASLPTLSCSNSRGSATRLRGLPVTSLGGFPSIILSLQRTTSLHFLTTCSTEIPAPHRSQSERFYRSRILRLAFFATLFRRVVYNPTSTPVVLGSQRLSLCSAPAEVAIFTLLTSGQILAQISRLQGVTSVFASTKQLRVAALSWQQDVSRPDGHRCISNAVFRPCEYGSIRYCGTTSYGFFSVEPLMR